MQTALSRVWFVALGFGVLLFSPVWTELPAVWLSEADHSHGFLVPLLSGYLIFSRRAALGAVPRRSSWGGVAALALAVAVYVVGLAGGLAVVQRAAVVAAVNAFVVAALGFAFYRAIAFPLLFLFMMIPMPGTVTGSVTFPLQLLATSASHLVLSCAGLPVSQAGNVLTTPAGALEVVEACSGIRSLMALLTVGLFLSNAWVRGRWERLAVVALAVPLAFLGNVLRISGTAAAMNWFGPRAAQGLPHEVIGLLAFGSVVIAYAAAANAARGSDDGAPARA